jgi:hypothetical protein
VYVTLPRQDPDALRRVRRGHIGHAHVVVFVHREIDACFLSREIRNTTVVLPNPKRIVLFHPRIVTQLMCWNAVRTGDAIARLSVANILGKAPTDVWKIPESVPKHVTVVGLENAGMPEGATAAYVYAKEVRMGFMYA